MGNSDLVINKLDPFLVNDVAPIPDCQSGNAHLDGKLIANTLKGCLIMAFGLVFNAVQANSIADAMQGAFGIDKIWVGITLAVLTGVVIFSGIRQIAQVAEFIVPFMALAYLGMALYVLIANTATVPDVFVLIVKSAFGYEQTAGGVAGALGLSSNQIFWSRVFGGLQDFREC